MGSWKRQQIVNYVRGGWDLNTIYIRRPETSNRCPDLVSPNPISKEKWLHKCASETSKAYNPLGMCCVVHTTLSFLQQEQKVEKKSTEGVIMCLTIDFGIQAHLILHKIWKKECPPLAWALRIRKSDNDNQKADIEKRCVSATATWFYLNKKACLEAHVCPRVGVSIFMKNLQIKVSDPMWICVFANYYRMVNISSTFALTENKTLDISWEELLLLLTQYSYLMYQKLEHEHKKATS
jgi:hypothetical protein